MLQPAVVGPLLDGIRNRTGAAGVFFYRFDIPNGLAYLAGWSGAEPRSAATPIDADLHLHRESPIVLHRAAFTDRRFAVFPEVASRRIEGVISVPLIHDEIPVGLLNIYRAEPVSVHAADLAAIVGLSLPMGALIAAGAEYARVSEQLADRKILERAKGILQASLAWTEEQAYLHLRRTSRRRRIAMRELAREVVEQGAARLEVRHAS